MRGEERRRRSRRSCRCSRRGRSARRRTSDDSRAIARVAFTTFPARRSALSGERWRRSRSAPSAAPRARSGSRPGSARRAARRRRRRVARSSAMAPSRGKTTARCTTPRVEKLQDRVEASPGPAVARGVVDEENAHRPCRYPRRMAGDRGGVGEARCGHRAARRRGRRRARGGDEWRRHTRCRRQTQRVMRRPHFGARRAGAEAGGREARPARTRRKRGRGRPRSTSRRLHVSPCSTRQGKLTPEVPRVPAPRFTDAPARPER